MTAITFQETVVVLTVCSEHIAKRALVAIALVGAIGCGEGASFRLNLGWEGTRPTFADPVYVTASVEELGAREMDAEPLKKVGPLEWIGTEQLQVQFENVPLGENRVVFAEIKESAGTFAPVLYYGISQPFSLVAGEHVEVDVRLALRPPPAQPNGPGVFILSAGGVTGSRNIELQLSSTAASFARVSEDARFSESRTTTITLGMPDAQSPSALIWNRRYRLGESAVPCPQAAGCARTVFVRFVDENGFESITYSDDVRLDQEPPGALAASVVSPAFATAEDFLTVDLRANELLAMTPTLTIPGLESFSFSRVFPEIDAPSSTYTMRSSAPAGHLGEDGTYDILAEMADTVGNASEVIVESVTVDRTLPAVISSTISPLRASIGDTISIEFGVNKQLVGPPVVLLDDSIVESTTLTGTTVSALRTIGVDDRQGLLVLTTRLEDLAGNVQREAIGNVFVDTRPPSVESVFFSPTEASAVDAVFLTVTLSEPAGLQVPGGEPQIEIEFDAQAPAGTAASFQFVERAGLSYIFVAAAGDLDSGQYGLVAVSAADALGNVERVPVTAVLSVDAEAPSISDLVVAPAALIPTIGASVTLTGALDGPVSDLQATLDGVEIGCTASGLTFQCVYAAMGNEVALGAERVAAVSVRATDGFGNIATAGSSVRFDRKAPEPVQVDVTYVPGPNSPLTTIARAGAGSLIRISVTADEPIDTGSPASLRLDRWTTSQAVTSAGFSVDVAADLTASGVYFPVIAWTDAVGNQSSNITLTTSVEVKRNPPLLTVNQPKLLFVRAPIGSSTPVPLEGPFSQPAGPYFSIAPAEVPGVQSAGAAALDADVFVSSDPIVQVRVWADPTQTTLLGELEPISGGEWPRTPLIQVDVPFVWVTAVDDAANESPPVQIQQGEWVGHLGPNASPSGSRLSIVEADHPVATAFGDHTTDSALAGIGGQVLSRTQSVRSERHGGSGGPDPFPRSRHGIVYDSARGIAVMFGGCGINNFDDLQECPAGYLVWDGAWSSRGGISPPPRWSHGMAYDSRAGEIVVFGGASLTGFLSSPSSNVYDDTWAWDGSSWREVNTTIGAPRPPDGPVDGMYYDSRRDNIVLLTSGETWLWDGDSWSGSMATAPTGFSAEGATFDAFDDQVILGNGDVWRWNGTSWQDLPFDLNTLGGGLGTLQAVATDPQTGISHALTFVPNIGAPAPRFLIWNGASMVTVDHPTGLISSAVSRRGGFWDAVSERYILTGGRPPVAPHRFETVAFDGVNAVEITERPAETILPSFTFEADLRRTGVDAELMSGVEVRAYAGGAGQPGDGASLSAWKSNGQGAVGAWLLLDQNSVAAQPSPPELPAGNAARLYYRGDTTDIQDFLFGDRRVFFRVASNHDPSVSTGTVRLALDYIEARVRYQAP